MTEDFLHFIWKFSLFQDFKLTTTTEQPITIIYPGIHNPNSGPDFLEAKIKIGERMWFGHVEIHIRASDWLKHGHQNDLAYDQVILHAVFDPDKEIYLRSPGDLPVLDLSRFLKQSYHDKYRDLSENLTTIACSNSISQVRPITMAHWLDRLAVHRCDRKSKFILQRVEDNQGDWRLTLYQALGIAFGFKVNAHAFSFLTESLPLRIIEHHKDSRFQIEALLFGQAGFLEGDISDGYPLALQNEYAFLRKKFGLYPQKQAIWKRSRMRPPNFPELRLAQLAAVLHNVDKLFRVMSEGCSASDLWVLLKTDVPGYWNTHSRIDRPCKPRNAVIGVSSIETIVINTLVPYLFAFGSYRGDVESREQALSLLMSVQPESNKITREWKQYNILALNAMESQALLELRNEFCANKKCLNCMVGVELLKN
ncbi:MAG: DUF2851 family protein [Flavobacteriales bacterium]|nr:DUF2851 family protein [Flavobacteriales bacterium]